MRVSYLLVMTLMSTLALSFAASDSVAAVGARSATVQCNDGFRATLQGKRCFSDQEIRNWTRNTCANRCSTGKGGRKCGSNSASRQGSCTI